ncbi:restriction endonuclease subunit S [Pseudomonas proteolytica]|uniref:restriction endonuclease subunit S n=1 Tax=Pseudomonas proteolytica TaxID=219574 RepID=UPI003207F90B
MQMAFMGDIAKVFNGKTPAKSEQREGGHPVLKIRDVDALGNIRGDFASFVDAEFATKFRAKHLCEGDTLILNAAHNSDYVASKTFYASHNHLGPLITGEWTVVRPDSALADSRYVRRYIESPDAKRLIKEMVNGIHLYPKDVARCPIPLPPLPEQRRIAAILDRADALRAMRREAIAKLDQLLQSVFLEMFGATIEATTSVAELAPSAGAIRTGPFGSQLLHSEFVDHGIAVLGIDNAVSNTFAWAKPRFITEEKYSQLSRYRVNPGDVLITIMGTCGRCAVVPDDIPTAINTKHLCCISIDRTRCEPEFLHSYFLLHPVARNYLESRAKGAIMAGLNMGIIKELPVALPSIEKQRHFVSIKKSLGRQLEQALTQEKRFDKLFAGLQQHAFAGTL